MTWTIAALVLCGFPNSLHRLALWADRRGWLYYRTKSTNPAPWLGTLDSIYKPEIEHVIEEESARKTEADQDDSGDRLLPGGL